MNRFLTALTLLTAIVLLVVSCTKARDIAVLMESFSYYNMGGTDQMGDPVRNTELKTIEMQGSDHNTIRLYYSDSMAASGFPSTTTMTVVGYYKAKHLGYRECYLEVITSETDTWLSTGTDHVSVKVYHSPERNLLTFEWADAAVQHFTTVPLSDVDKVNGKLVVQ